ncbi:MAG: MFS transporter [Candidatus Andeanibacterium colombiense]|uniref:MFS transporter n=1 Tax=Candidatus Andeanibacterium colombiense TaxID=3121345 RepID=A0AAJ5X843_9SPHN|nr:MAG: MFS transporter [Sphingomonadaceae bacterium]
MATPAAGGGQVSTRFLKLLIFVMFATFAMTTDSVGTIIPSVIAEYRLGMTAAGSFHYASMSGIGIAAILLGFLADRIGRKGTILLGLTLFGATSALFAAGNAFALFVLLLFVSGLGIGIFKSGALALIGDVSASTREHASNMNLVEGFFGVGAIIGPAIVTMLLQSGASWKWLYLIAGGLCALLILGTAFAPFPRTSQPAEDRANPREALAMLADRQALFFAALLVLYVAAEAAVYVWAPTYFIGYHGPGAWLAAFVVSVFFVLRAAGRFLGAFLLSRFDWTAVLAFCSTAMAVLFVIAVAGGRPAAVFCLPATGLFMSVLYPTINSTGISLFDKHRHGSIAGFLLFFTCIGAVLAPLAMGALGDALGNSDYSMGLGALFAVALAVLCLWNRSAQPAAERLARRDSEDYGSARHGA